MSKKRAVASLRRAIPPALSDADDDDDEEGYAASGGVGYEACKTVVQKVLLELYSLASVVDRLWATRFSSKARGDYPDVGVGSASRSKGDYTGFIWYANMDQENPMQTVLSCGTRAATNAPGLVQLVKDDLRAATEKDFNWLKTCLLSNTSATKAKSLAQADEWASQQKVLQKEMKWLMDAVNTIEEQQMHRAREASRAARQAPPGRGLGDTNFALDSVVGRAHVSLQEEHQARASGKRQRFPAAEPRSPSVDVDGCVAFFSSLTEVMGEKAAAELLLSAAELVDGYQPTLAFALSQLSVATVARHVANCLSTELTVEQCIVLAEKAPAALRACLLPATPSASQAAPPSPSSSQAAARAPPPSHGMTTAMALEVAKATHARLQQISEQEKTTLNLRQKECDAAERALADAKCALDEQESKCAIAANDAGDAARHVAACQAKVDAPKQSVKQEVCGPPSPSKANQEMVVSETTEAFKATSLGDMSLHLVEGTMVTVLADGASGTKWQEIVDRKPDTWAYVRVMPNGPEGIFPCKRLRLKRTFVVLSPVL